MKKRLLSTYRSGTHVILSKLFMLLFCLLPFLGNAVPKSWTGGGGNSNWHDGTNWNPAGVPASADLVTIGTGFTVDIINANATALSITLDGSAQLAVAVGRTLTLSGGMTGVTLNGTSILTISGELNITNPALSGLLFTSSSSASLNNSGVINISQTAGSSIEVLGNDCTILNFAGTININNTSGAGNGIALGSNDNDFTNFGTINIATGGNAISGSGSRPYSNSGTIVITAATNAVHVSGSQSFVNNGQFTATGITNYLVTNGTGSGGSFENSMNGILQGSGTIEAAIFSSTTGSTLKPGNDLGTFTFDDDEDFSNTTISIELGGVTVPGTDFDQIEVSGEATIGAGSKLEIALVNGFVPIVGDAFALIDATTTTGIFGSLSLSNCCSWVLSYGTIVPGEIIITVNLVLPVELTFFEGTFKENNVALIWETASETNNEGWDIEFSPDGKNWSAIGFVAGKGNTVKSNTYKFSHRNFKDGNNYYRLLQKDWDGKSAYSEVIVVKANIFGPTLENLAVFPNPATGKTVWIEFKQWSSYQPSFIHIYTISGKKVYQGRLNAQREEINLGNLSAGSYIVELLGPQSTGGKRLLILGE